MLNITHRLLKSKHEQTKGTKPYFCLFFFRTQLPVKKMININPLKNVCFKVSSLFVETVVCRCRKQGGPFQRFILKENRLMFLLVRDVYVAHHVYTTEANVESSQKYILDFFFLLLKYESRFN